MSSNSLYNDRPYCACSTPAGSSGIAVIRLSGEDSGKVADRVITIVRSYGSYDSVEKMPGYTSAFAKLNDPDSGELIDEVVVSHFVPPYSYTGEELVEISCHGGSVIKQEIIRVLIESGARAAEPGEFTKRAFLNGKMDLSSAEAVMNVISSESERALKASNTQLNGKLREILENSERRLYSSLSLIEMILEFPEHDDTPENTRSVYDTCVDVYRDLFELSNSYAKGKILSERMKVALCGLPNSGKSTLLNVLSGYDRAIVTEVAGTTRDTLDVQVNINGIPVTLVDTAGLHDTSDKIEAIGIERAYEVTKESDLVLYLIAPDASLATIKEQLTRLVESGVNSSRIVLIYSKNDLGINPNEAEISVILGEIGINTSIRLSSSENLAIDDLKEIITAYYENLGGTASSEIILMNKRHAVCIDNALGHLQMGIDALNADLGVDIVSSVLRMTLDCLGEITGKSVSAELVDSIFANFCIGK